MVNVELTPREREIVELLRVDPLLDSRALAERLTTSREAVNVHLSNLGRKGAVLGRGYVVRSVPHVVVVGGTNVDVKARSAAGVEPGTSNPGTTTTSPGGVGRNVAENLARLGTPTHLVSVVGADALGDQVVQATEQAGVHTEHVRRTAARTGTYTAVLDPAGELVAAVADMEATRDLDHTALDRARQVIVGARMLVLDGNLEGPTVAAALGLAAQHAVPVVLDPVSAPKARRLADALDGRHPVHTLTPTVDELGALTGRTLTADRRRLARAARDLHERGVDRVWVRLGARGSLVSTARDGVRPDAVFAAPAADVVDVTGAGDAMLAAYVHALLRGAPVPDAVRLGHAAAAATVASHHTVRPDLAVVLAPDLTSPTPGAPA